MCVSLKSSMLVGRPTTHCAENMAWEKLQPHMRTRMHSMRTAKDKEKGRLKPVEAAHRSKQLLQNSKDEESELPDYSKSKKKTSLVHEALIRLARPDHLK